TGSPDAFKLAFSWFQNCKANHDTSGDGAKPPILPTRVVNFSNKDNLQLVESQGARGQYLCLSHRWLRDNEMFRCTHDNITQLKQHIEWDSLTRTFQQAITFAQAFATWHCKTYSNHEPIRYIWIDSICIMQDSPEDWAKEAGLMCSVYENATLTIASAVGGNGCFAVADQVFKGFEITSPRHLRTQLYLRRPLPHFDLGFISIMARISRDEEPQSNSLDLLTRGWVLQERLLSKRFLIFGPHELLWECLRTVDCECGFLTNQSNTNALGESPTAKYLKAAYERSQKENPNNLLFPTPLKIGHYKSLLDAGGRQKHSQRWWQRVVEVYTRTNLTKASDRLPALAGLAKQFSRINSGQRYLAGMWEEMLIESLTWFVEETAEKPRVSTSSVTSDSLISVPSWSWAS
ncbi:heterokaryon incompatibility protein-domain-containing protein, partial [Ilyonectria destructans]